jgi:diguanylate cyclase (GGDEF)-like protein/PAS domain S-box-containing protein
MQGTYDSWLVACSYMVAVAASYAALELAARVGAAQGRLAAGFWLSGGSVALGLGIWSMHFVGMLAFHLPIPLHYDLTITLLSVVPAVLSAAFVLALARRGMLSGGRLAGAAVLLGCGIVAMHYTGMAAIPIRPAIRYHPGIFAASVVVAMAAAYVALKLAFSLSGTAVRWKKLAAAMVMGGGICAMHYTGMAAAVFAADAVCAVPTGALDSDWLAGIVAFNTMFVLLVTTAVAFYDARQARRNAQMVTALEAANAQLVERTRRAEQLTAELQASEEKFRILFEQAVDAHLLFERGRVFDCNRGALTLLGCGKKSQLIGLPLTELSPPTQPNGRDSAEMAAAMSAIALEEGHHRFEWLYRRLDGSEIPVEVALTPIELGGRTFMLSVWRDLTERKQREAEMVRTREQLRMALRASQLALFEWDVGSGEVFLDERWGEMIGLEAAPTRTTISALARRVHPDDVDELRGTIRQMLRGDPAFYDAEHRVETAYGDYIWIHGHGKVVERNADGKALRVSGTNADITARKRAELALSQTNDELRQSVVALEWRNREMQLLAEIGNVLQSCVTVDEACNEIATYGAKLFPGERGALYLFKHTREELEPSATWGEAHGGIVGFNAEDCWALRRGKAHAVPDPQRSSICRHVGAGEAVPPYICIPLIVQSDPLGLWWSTLAEHDAPGDAAEVRRMGMQQLAHTLSEQIALALSNIRLRQNLREQTFRDPLTGLYNRRFLEETLRREVARGARSGAPFSIMMLDLDHFKRVNDGFGHDAGDLVLRRVARALQDNTRASDIVCRFGGEEFMVVLPDTDRDGAVARAERILASVRNLQLAHDGNALGSITTSIGLALHPRHGETVTALVQSADQALYAAKGAGRDRLMVAGE